MAGGPADPDRAWFGGGGLSSAGGAGSSAADAGCFPGHGSHGGARCPPPPSPAAEPESAPATETPDLVTKQRKARNREAAQRSRAKRKGAVDAKTQHALGLPGGIAIVQAAIAAANQAAEAAVGEWGASPASPQGGTGETKGARLFRLEEEAKAAASAVKLLRNQKSAHKVKVYSSTYEEELNAALERALGRAEFPVGSGACVPLGGDDPPLEARRPSPLAYPAESRGHGNPWRGSPSAEPPEHAPLAPLPASGVSSFMVPAMGVGIVPRVTPPLDALHEAGWLKPFPRDVPAPDGREGLPSWPLQEERFPGVGDGSELLPLPMSLLAPSSAGGEAAFGAASSRAAASMPDLLVGAGNNGSSFGEDERPEVLSGRKRSPFSGIAGGGGWCDSDDFHLKDRESTDAAQAG